jgi:hypothetical protein
MRVGATFQPELCCVVGEGFGMPRDELLVPGGRPGAPLTGLRDTADLAQDAGQQGRVLRVVGGDCQRLQQGEGRICLTQLGLDLGQVAPRRSVVG